MSDLPPPKQPYRGAALLHAVLAAAILVVAFVSEGDVVTALVVAVVYFVVATGWSWFRFRQREGRAGARKSDTSAGGDGR